MMRFRLYDEDELSAVFIYFIIATGAKISLPKRAVRVTAVYSGKMANRLPALLPIMAMMTRACLMSARYR